MVREVDPFARPQRVELGEDRRASVARMKVLHVSHTATISGAEHSLLALLAAMPPEVELGVACPEGALAAAVRKLGLPVHHIAGTSASFRLHPVRTARAVAQLGAAALAVRRIARRHGATVLHANSVRAGLITRLAGTLFGPPAVVHVRDVLPEGATARAIKRALTSNSAELIAISHYVERKFASPGSDARMTVIDNPVDQRRFEADSCDAGECRRMLGVDGKSPLIGIVGQITPWKGHDTAIRAFGLIRQRHPDAMLLVVGDVKFSAPGTSLDNYGFLRGLHALIRDLGMTDDVVFLGERDDIPQVMRALDVLLVPSTAEPFGRTVAEAMTMGTPVIATTEGGPSELLEHGVSGLLAPPGDHQAWATAIDQLVSDRPAARQMAQAARTVAQVRFEPDRHVRSMLAVLESAATRRR